ncbi:hypothetical protein Micbo1qcDRAFT_237521 [Microdochium bolleyi]|uniref:SET domain-containing protein n=1 Tax=Microdochium bolleyi TaxID=196109 RepID=A0A136IK41_9PEZI|nr:hypothetical protein Micbo1qcDRAFT_237521 [Microdochium bolleyi]
MPPSPSDAEAPTIHPALAVRRSATKGRMVVAASAIEPRTTLMVDLPYALVPAPRAHDPPFSFCSRDRCHRRLPLPSQTAVTCPQRCAPEVVWCSQDCRAQDTARHQPECAWLRSGGCTVRQKHGEFGFELLWLLAKMFIRKHCDGSLTTTTATTTTRDADADADADADTTSHFNHRGWDSVWDLAGSPASFPDQDVRGWRDLARAHLVDKIPGVACTLDQAVGLVCRIETNSFGLYPGVTGEFPITQRQGRGEYYGSGLYPTAAMFNHACCPNVSHRLDEHNRRVFSANRKIMPGEECCISYFDLVDFQDAAVRRHEVRTKWTFACDCQRCQDDADEKLPDFLSGLGLDVDSD